MNRLVEGSRGNAQSLIAKVIGYVVNRQNEDGGYTFAQGTESSAQDTYYGLAILNSLKACLPNLQKTIRFLNALNLDSIYSDYYIAKALQLCGVKVEKTFKERLASRLSSEKYFGSVEVFSEVPSEFITTFMALELADLLKIDVQTREIIRWLLRFRNKDGGFGTQGQSNINSTFYAAASLRLLNFDLKASRGVVEFVRSCEKPYGGFTVLPESIMPYMEHTYYGIMTLDLFGEKTRYPSQTIEWVLKCQNKNGGFARSDLGISTFVDTYYAITTLQKLTL
ncbi:hypothetical protein G4O51_00735 [Candidatus Bathyarchaeota archaeon A05DMB-2]|jgi:hypothetical protein|nr:hypothetical protein [Candidatus Bathyarchaeota archaeon A05DMB-2]